MMSNPGSPSKSSSVIPNHEHKGYGIVDGMTVEKPEDPWDMSNRDPVADLREMIRKLDDPEEQKKRRKRMADDEKLLSEAIQQAYEAGMSPEEIFYEINKPFFLG
jgi:hypothetical protein